jgi:prevent-host-death family protein
VKIVNIHEAKTHLSRLLAEVAGGEEIVIAKAGKPIARLVPADRPRRMADLLDIDRGRITVHDDFPAPLPDDLLTLFDGQETASADSP